MRLIAFTYSVVTLALFASLAACAAGSGHDGGRPGMADGCVFTMQPGQEVALPDGGGLHYVRVADDSRCQPDVQCIWAGDAEVVFEWAPVVGASQSFSLHTGKEPRQQALGSRRLTLVALARGPSPAAQLRIDRTPSP